MLIISLSASFSFSAPLKFHLIMYDCTYEYIEYMSQTLDVPLHAHIYGKYDDDLPPSFQSNLLFRKSCICIYIYTWKLFEAHFIVIQVVWEGQKKNTIRSSFFTEYNGRWRYNMRGRILKWIWIKIGICCMCTQRVDICTYTRT